MCASVGAVLGRPSTSLAGSYLLFSFMAPLASWRFVLWAGPRQTLNFVGRFLSPLFFLGALGVLAVRLMSRSSADPQLRWPVPISSFLSWRPWRLGGSSFAPVLGRPSTSAAGSYLLISFLATLASWRFLFCTGPRQTLNLVGRFRISSFLSWRPWRLGGSSYGACHCRINCPLGFDSVSGMPAGREIQPPSHQGLQGEGNSTAKTPRTPRGEGMISWEMT